MNRKSKISIYLLATGIVLFIVLSAFSILNAWQAEKRQFNFTKQYYLSTAFYESNVDKNALLPLFEAYGQTIRNDSIDRNKINEKYAREATRSYGDLELRFKDRLRSQQIDTAVDVLVIISFLQVEIADSLHVIYDLDRFGSFLPIGGNANRFDLSVPDNTFFFSQVDPNLNLQVSAYVKFRNPGVYLLGKIRPQIIIVAFMLVVFIVIVVFTIRTIMNQQRVDHMKTDFINNMTHELKTPLATLSIVSKTIVPTNIEYVSETITNQVKRLESTIDQVMKLSTLTAGILEVSSINIKSFFEDLVANFKPIAKDVSLLINGLGESDKMFADAFLLETAIINLLDNAIKYGESSPILIDVQILEKNIKIKVSDNGPGIPIKYKKWVFEKFYRIPHGDTHNVKGAGLGLFHVRQIALAHGGDVSIQANSPKGTSVIIKIPQL